MTEAARLLTKTASIPKLKREIRTMLSKTFKTMFVIFIPAKDFALFFSLSKANGISTIVSKNRMTAEYFIR